MTWARLDDNCPGHPKVSAAGPLAWVLWTRGLIYCNRYLTDGFIPRNQVNALVDWATEGVFVRVQRIVTESCQNFPKRTASICNDSAECDFEPVNNFALAQRLVDVGLWEIVNGGYKVHDFYDWNYHASTVKRKQKESRNQRVQAGKASAAARARRQRESNENPTDGERKVNGPSTGMQNDARQGVNENVTKASTKTQPRSRSIYTTAVDTNSCTAHTDPRQTSDALQCAALVVPGATAIGSPDRTDPNAELTLNDFQAALKSAGLSPEVYNWGAQFELMKPVRWHEVAEKLARAVANRRGITKPGPWILGAILHDREASEAIANGSPAPRGHPVDPTSNLTPQGQSIAKANQAAIDNPDLLSEVM